MRSIVQNLDIVAVFYDKHADVFIFFPVIWSEFIISEDPAETNEEGKLIGKTEIRGVVLFGGTPTFCDSLPGFCGYELITDHPDEMSLDLDMWNDIAIEKKIKKVKKVTKAVEKLAETILNGPQKSNVLPFRKRNKNETK